MRIAISGTLGQGKTTLVKDFLKEWPNYTRSPETFRKLIKEQNIPIRKNVNKESQWKLLNAVIDDVQNTKKGDNIIFDRCPLDNIIFSLWSTGTASSDIDKDFIGKCAPLIKESMRFIDIIFFLPMTQVAPVVLREDIDPIYAEELDNIFKAVQYQIKDKDESPFFLTEDRPPIIEIFGTPRQRIELIKLYIDSAGDAVNNSESVLDPKNLDAMETLLKEQKLQKEKDAAASVLVNNIIKPYS